MAEGRPGLAYGLAPQLVGAPVGLGVQVEKG
jgi:hypothetical protein